MTTRVGPGRAGLASCHSSHLSFPSFFTDSYRESERAREMRIHRRFLIFCLPTHTHTYLLITHYCHHNYNLLNLASIISPTTMKFSYLSSILFLPLASAFAPQSYGITQYNAGAVQKHQWELFSTPSPEDIKRMMEAEASDPTTLAESAERMKNMTPEDMSTLIAEMENMDPVQKAQLKGMGMDPDTMLISMKMMKDNPAMMATAQKLMSNMTPEEMMKQSREAQEKMSSMSKEELEAAAEDAKKQMEQISPDMIDEAVKAMKDASAADLNTSADPNVIDTMYKVGELMSKPPTGKVTFQAFSVLPPIAALSGAREQDLSKQELAECWEEGSLGATRVDRAAFKRVWDEVQEYFEEDIMEESRLTIHAKVAKKRSAVTPEVQPGAAAPVVGQSLDEDQMKFVNQQVKNMSDDDMVAMLEGMSNIGPEEEARMKAMGADPAMMRKAAEMMKSNPMMRKAASMMMKNMSPDQMMTASQQAQSQMQNMSKEDMQKAFDEMNKNAK